MFIRQVKKQRSPSSKTFYQFNLVQAERIDGKVKQRVILYLGSDPLLRDPDNRKMVLNILKARIFGQPELFPDHPPQELVELTERYYEKYRLRYEQQPDQAPSVPTARDALHRMFGEHDLDIIDSETHFLGIIEAAIALKRSTK